VPGAEGYVVWRAGEKDGEPAAVAHVRETTFTDLKVVDGTTYLYSLIAVNSSGDSPASHLVSATPRSAPAAPAGLTGSTGDGQVSIRWEPSDGATTYRIKRASNREGPYDTIANVETTSFTDSGVQNGTTYFYIVRAISLAGKSPYSARLRATPRAKPPAPEGVAAVLRDGLAVLTWKPVDKAQGYRIQRASTESSEFLLAGTTRGSSWTDKTPGDPAVRFRVTSVVAGAESDPSGAVQAVPPAPEPPPKPPGPDDEVPTLESIVAPSLVPEALPPGVDLEKLEDLKRVEHLRRVFQDTGQKFDPWEVLTLLSEEGKGTRKDIEIVLRLRDQNKQEQFTTGALSLFERILKVRSAHAGFVRRLREFIGTLEIPGASDSALEIALGFLLSAAKGRARAAQWLQEPEKRKAEAAGFLGHALDLARSYVGAMQAGEED
jgi:fibronectin type 3 domain-containing protein